MNTSVFEEYSGFTDELQLAIEKTGTLIRGNFIAWVLP
jgi:hypothetical protein